MFKQIVGFVAVILTLAGYVPYIRDTLKGKTTPHIYTWFLWSLLSFIGFALQMSDKAGPGAFVTLTAAIAGLFICIVGFRKGSKNITFSDTVFLILALLSLVIWLFAKQPVVSTILISVTDLLAFFPTLRKSWRKPEEETLSSYVTNTFRFGLALVALEKYTIISSLSPWTWVFMNGIFSIFLIVRRKQLSKGKSQ